LEQSEEGDGLGQPVLAAELLVEIDAAPTGEGVAQRAQASLERDGRPDVADVEGRGNDEQIAERGAEALWVVSRDRGVERDPPQAGWQRRRAVEVAARGLEAG